MDPESPGTHTGTNGTRAVELPSPNRERFIPLRGGILNLWQYDDHEFWFHSGRLLLRGENGMGKSKALELLLPFLLDADTSPHRLDPFGDGHKSMRWNLLEDGLHQSRLGYAWLEFGRTDESGIDRFVTIGAGLRATQSTAGADSWYFVAHGRRGLEFDLVEDGVPHNKAHLSEVLEGIGVVNETGRDHRRSVDTTLFGFGDDRYSALVELLLQLRRPQLSAKLDLNSLSGLLTASLPPLDDRIVTQLADAFERLEHDADELAGLRRSVESLEVFVAEYRRYAQVVSRRVARAVRQATTKLDDVTRTVREAERTVEHTEARLAELETEKDESESAAAAAKAAIEVIDDSQAMHDANRLRTAQDDVRVARADAGRAAAEHQQSRTAVERKQKELRAAEERTATAHARMEAAAAECRELAGSAGLEIRHAAHESGLLTEPETALAGAEIVVTEQRRAVDRLQDLQAATDSAAARVAEQERVRAGIKTKLDDALEQAGAAEAAVELARSSLEEAAEGWRSDLVELQLEPATFGSLLQALLDAGLDDAPDPRDVLQTPASAYRRASSEALADTNSESVRVEARITELLDERETAEHSVLEPPRTRTRPGREERVGAALWRVCDFADHLSARERAHLEAALEDSGLLDAWITPDGAMLPPAELEVVLSPDPLEGPTLRDVLVPDLDQDDVAPEVVEVALRSISVGSSGAHRVDLDGTWSLGPLQGAWTKDEPDFIGSAARERTRLRWLERIDAALNAHRARLAELSSQRDRLTEAATTFEREIAGFPSTASLVRARAEERQVAVQVAGLHDELARSDEVVEVATVAHVEAERELRRAADQMGLAGRLGRLTELRDAIASYWVAVVKLTAAARSALDAETEQQRRNDELAEIDAAVKRWREQEKELAQRLAALEAKAEQLRAGAGADVKAVLAQRQEQTDRLGRLESHLKQLHAHEKAASLSLGEARGALQRTQDERAGREDARRHAVESFVRLVQHGLVGLAIGTPPPADETGWSMSRSLEVARSVEASTAQVPSEDSDRDRADNRATSALNDLERDLGGDFGPRSHRADGWLVTRIEHNGRIWDAPSLLEGLRAEIERRHQLLDDQEREIIQRHLLEELGQHLQDRIADARSLVSGMNQQLASHPTASGLVVKLKWSPEARDIPGIEEALRSLDRNLALLDDAERDALARFLQERIQGARKDQRAGSYADHLAGALDYRSWHSFTLLTIRDGRQRTLTRKEHGSASGGEKSVTLHLPLFAAAAAHYRSASKTAPHLVMLDEAFAGIDQGMRGRCMKLLADFDLDLVMTSHDEWGCYPELPGLAIYELAREPGRRGVAAIRFTWDGHERALDDPHLEMVAQA
ncbi:MAG: TIGR02680 family protein [Actinobacteria bacterium]|nr:TIGR02680 family protein [Actinomycetota bacterium]